MDTGRADLFVAYDAAGECFTVAVAPPEARTTTSGGQYQLEDLETCFEKVRVPLEALTTQDEETPREIRPQAGEEEAQVRGYSRRDSLYPNPRDVGMHIEAVQIEIEPEMLGFNIKVYINDCLWCFYDVKYERYRLHSKK